MEPDCSDVIIIGAQPTGNKEIYNVTIVTGIPPIWLSYFTVQ